MNRPPFHAWFAVATVVLMSPILLQLAYGYLDPGTGSYMLQLIIGGLMGGLLTVGLFWKRIVAAVKRIFARRNSDAGHGT
jgi:hypothetical protein